MGKILKSDIRYQVLATIPHNRNGIVEFRKKRDHANNYLMSVMEIVPNTFTTVLYKTKGRNGVTELSFDYAVRPDVSQPFQS
jgi:hypothetical protein